MQELYDKLISFLVEKGKGTSYLNKDVIEFAPGELDELNNILIRIDERKKTMKKYNIPNDLEVSQND
jgi:hypothetical protein